jgi:Zn finger protein HypA/HybF involved in hydrogenase expression
VREEHTEAPHQFACSSCGAALEFAPGTSSMVCPYCGARTAIDVAAASGKQDYVAYASRPHVPVAELPPFTITCRNCGTPTTTTAVSCRCGSCQGSLVNTDDLGGELKAPDGIVAFAVDKNAAATHFKEWSTSRWFAPNALKKVIRTDTMRGSYLPHWAFDDNTTSDYTGQRGEHYYTTETYTTQENGQTVTRTRQVQHTRWYPAAGRVSRAFVDVLATGVTQPDSDTLDKLGPWSTATASGYESEFLAGFDTPRYDVMADAGFSSAKQQMAQVIEQDCRQDIGGDEQQVSSVTTYDADLLFRLLLLPLWLATYVFAGTTYHVYVNANTGKVIGERPYSKLKIAVAVLLALLVIGAGLLAYQYNR